MLLSGPFQKFVEARRIKTIPCVTLVLKTPVFRNLTTAQLASLLKQLAIRCVALNSSKAETRTQKSTASTKLLRQRKTRRHRKANRKKKSLINLTFTGLAFGPCCFAQSRSWGDAPGYVNGWTFGPKSHCQLLFPSSSRKPQRGQASLIWLICKTKRLPRLIWDKLTCVFRPASRARIETSPWIGGF